MSARSRYLDAISPKSTTSENNNNEFSTTQPIKPSINIKNGVVRSVSNNTNTNTSISGNGSVNSRGQQQQLISPSNLQQNRSINNSFTSTNNNSNNYTNNYTNNSNNTTNNISTRNKLLASAPPPPPPPGPPPKRVGSSSSSSIKTKLGSQRTSNNSVGNNNNNNVSVSGNNNNRPVIKYTGDPSINNNQVVAVDNNVSSNVPQNSAPPSAQQPIEESSPAKKTGSIWSPQNEVQSGSVKSMTMKLWGSSKVNSPKKSTGPKVGSKIAAAQQSMQNSGLGLGLDSRHATQIHPSTDHNNSRQGSRRAAGPGSLGGRTESGHIDSNRALSPPRSQTQMAASPSNYLRPPATPPRHTGQATSNFTESPKYKRNAPPTLSTGNEPSSSHHQQRIISPNRIGPRGSSTQQATPSPSLLERRRMANNLNLTPVDTSFGNNKRSNSQQPYVGASHSTDNQNSIDSREVVKPTNSTIEGSIGLNASGNLLSPRHLTDTRKAYSYGASMSGSFDRGGSSYAGSPTEGNNLRSPPYESQDARQGRGYQRSDTAKISNVLGSANDISTLTAFKRPGTKVGIVFTRLSSNHPEVAVISKILPESIFSRHSLSGSKDGKLEGAQIIAVNGINVNDPRHAAELVARATEEVRLTVKKRPLSSVWDQGQGQGGSSPTSGDYGGGKRASTEAALSSPHKLQRSVNASTKSQEGIELDTYGVPRTRSRGDESELSVRTEEGDNEEPSRTSPREAANHYRGAPQAAQGYSGAVSTAAATLTSRSNMTSTTTMTPKSAEIAERRRKVAQAMLLSEELVEDPIKEENDMPMPAMQLNRSSDSASLEMGIEQTFSEGYPDKSVVTAASSSAAPSGVSGGASAADKRRQAALEMYHSDIMVADNVDDEQLGTIEVVSPSSKQQQSSPTINAANLATIDAAASEGRDTIGLMPGGSLSRMNKPPSEAGSTTRTDITTSSAVTERMGGSSPVKRSSKFSGRSPPSADRENFTFDSSGAEMAAASRLVANTSLSPTSSTDSGGSSSPAKRRMQRAAQRQAGIASSGDAPARIKLPLSPSSGVSSPVVAPKSLTKPPASTQLSPGMSSVQSNEDSVAVSHVTTASSVAASSTAGRSDVSFGNRSTRSALRFGRKKASSGQSVASVDTTSSSSKKKKGIFGVAKMIRKASSKKSKSRGISLDDDEMFDEAAEDESPSVMSGSQMSAKSPGVVSSPVEEEKGEQEAMSMPPPLMDASPGKAASQAGSADPFATPKSPVGGGDDSLWANSDFFKDDPFGASSPFGTSTGEDAFGFPSTNNTADDAFFPAGSWGEPSAVDYTPKNSNQQSFDYDEATETSEITNPTYASAAVKSQATADTKPKPVDAPEDDSSASTPVDGCKDGLKYAKKSRGGVRLPPPSSQADGRDDDDQGRGTPTTTPALAKSRILSKYSKGKTRRQQANAANTSLGTIHSMDDDETDKNTSMSSARSIGSTSTSNSLKKKRAMQAAADSTPVRTNSASPVKQQQVINPATTSALANRRRGGRMSPIRTDNATLNKASSPLRGSPTNKYLSPTRKNRASPSVVDNPSYYSMESRLDQIKDPIQRAGVRLLWAAAIPIQTQARRFLARQAAIRRMCAVLTIQAFVRRWLAERDLEIAIWSAIQIQSTFRGWFARDSLEDNHYCATQIQRVVRGYLATMHVFEDLYSITIVQSVVRMHLSINDAVDRLSSIIAIQAWWRGIKTRDDIEEMDYSAVAIQANWRRYLGQMSYQFDIIDIIIVQSVARRWKTRRDLAAKRIQCLARVVIAKKRFQQKKGMQSLVTRHTSATKIAARWRAHAAQMQLLHELSAMKIQSCWRSYTAQVQLLISIVNVILIQSLWRRRAAMKLYKPLLKRIKLAKDRKKTNAATTIQSAWRGFVVYSEYLIKRYENKAAVTIQAHWRGYWQLTSYSLVYCEIVKIQALVRGHQERSWQDFQKECATIIQAAGRRFLARKEVHNECMVSILIAAAANSLRVRNAAGKIQHWWMAEMWQRREKRAALVIERFFIYVKKEVEKEVKALKKKKKAKRRQRKMKQSDDYILERAWLGVAEDTAAAAPMMPAPQQQRAMPNQMKVYNKQDRYSSSRGVIQTLEDDQQSEVSGLTDLDFGRSGSRKLK